MKPGQLVRSPASLPWPSLRSLNCVFLIFSANSMPLMTTAAVRKRLSQQASGEGVTSLVGDLVEGALFKCLLVREADSRIFGNAVSGAA